MQNQTAVLKDTNYNQPIADWGFVLDHQCLK